VISRASLVVFPFVISYQWYQHGDSSLGQILVAQAGWMDGRTMWRIYFKMNMKYFQKTKNCTFIEYKESQEAKDSIKEYSTDKTCLRYGNK
jgi:hypothetical protein